MHHPLQTAVAVAAALVASAFGLSTLERWLSRRRRHELAWAVALGMFALAAAALAAGAQAGWSGAAFRIFYLFGAIADVPVLALGTVYLLGGRRTGDRAAVVVGTFVVFAAGVLVSTRLRAPLPRDQLAQGSAVFQPLPRILAALGSAGGAVVILAGAVWSAWRVWRERAPRHLLWSNGLIAAGTLVLAAGGTLNSVVGAMTAFAITLLAGIVCIFAGFLVAAGAARGERAIPPARPWWPSAAAGARPTAATSAGAGAGAPPLSAGARATPGAAASLRARGAATPRS